MVHQRHDLVNLRKAAGFTQESLAAEVGADRSAVWRWESGRSVPEPITQPRLARALGVTQRELATILARSEPVAAADDDELSAGDWTVAAAADVVSAAPARQGWRLLYAIESPEGWSLKQQVWTP